jgi:hypothetical protein
MCLLIGTKTGSCTSFSYEVVSIIFEESLDLFSNNSLSLTGSRFQAVTSIVLLHFEPRF